MLSVCFPLFVGSTPITTVEFKNAGEGTHLIYTEQGAFLDGHDTSAQREHGTNILLDNLGEVLLLNHNISETVSDREIVNTRIFNASREHIFKAFSNPDHLIHWWGPSGFSNTFHEFNMQTGGVWHYVMHGPNGVDYENKSVFVEVVEPERIVLRHLEPDHEFLLTVTLSELDSRTRLTWHMLFDSSAECNKVKEFVVEANEQNLDRLEAQLVKIVV